MRMPINKTTRNHLRHSHNTIHITIITITPHCTLLTR